MSTRINRITMFKLPDPEAQKKLLAAYDVLAKEQSKVPFLHDKPYSRWPLSPFSSRAQEV
jgi:hypothetical protein